MIFKIFFDIFFSIFLIIFNQLVYDSKYSRLFAQKYLQVIKDHGSFKDFLWCFVNRKPIIYFCKTVFTISVTTKESDKKSNALKDKGFKFVRVTICYAFIQAVGMVNDHITTCYRYKKIKVFQCTYSKFGGIL